MTETFQIENVIRTNIISSLNRFGNSVEKSNHRSQFELNLTT